MLSNDNLHVAKIKSQRRENGGINKLNTAIPLNVGSDVKDRVKDAGSIPGQSGRVPDGGEK